MYAFQFGFRKDYITDATVLDVTRNVCNGLDDGFSGVGGIFYNFLKIFDFINHHRIQWKLSLYGIVVWNGIIMI